MAKGTLIAAMNIGRAAEVARDVPAVDAAMGLVVDVAVFWDRKAAGHNKPLALLASGNKVELVAGRSILLPTLLCLRD